MKKLLYILIISLLFIPNVLANEINKISMDVLINADGSAKIKETWSVYSSSGTEIYKTYNNVGTSEFKDFKVSLNGREFTNIGSWLVNASFSDKAYKNGINYISDGLELCFGISAYGNQTYTFEYTITDFVIELNDSQMVYWTLVPKNLSNNVDDVYIKIHSDFKYADTLDIWGYGKYGAPAYVYDGYIEMSAQNLTSSEYMTALIKFPKGSFNLNQKIDKDFSYYEEMAEEDAIKYSDEKKKKSVFEIIMSIILPLIFVVIPILFLIILINAIIAKNSIYKKSKNKIPKDTPAFRDIPKGDLFHNYYIASLYELTKKDTDLLGSILLKWLKEGYITIEKVEKNGLFKKNEIITAMKLGTVKTENSLEERIYTMIKKAAKDDYLEKDEFKKWAKNHYQELLDWFDDVKSNEAASFIEDGLITKTITRKFLFKMAKFTEDEHVFVEAKQLYGLKKYLNEFSNMKEKEAIEVKLWQEYLIYAQMFGIADKVAKQFKKMYPEVIEGYNYDFDTIILINDFSHTAIKSATDARQAAIDRANSYSSGGGGFSSGGGGGGSFGGGSGGGGFR